MGFIHKVKSILWLNLTILIATIFILTTLSVTLVVGIIIGTFLLLLMQEVVDAEIAANVSLVVSTLIAYAGSMSLIIYVSESKYANKLAALSKESYFKNPKIFSSSESELLKITAFFYSPKSQKEVFEPIIADWREEYFEALNKKEIWKSRWINIRYTYAFLAAMWQKSPLDDLIEFIKKHAK